MLLKPTPLINHLECGIVRSVGALAVQAVEQRQKQEGRGNREKKERPTGYATDNITESQWGCSEC